jgi:hypothetical protein
MGSMIWIKLTHNRKKITYYAHIFIFSIQKAHMKMRIDVDEENTSMVNKDNIKFNLNTIKYDYLPKR